MRYRPYVLLSGRGSTIPKAAAQPARSYWLREAVAQDAGDPAPQLREDMVADVVIIGGGFTGLWSAFFLTEVAPGMQIVVLEKDVCGGGPSGRNGGFVTGWWDELETLVSLFGRDAALKACRAVARSVTEIGEWCQVHGVDAWYRHAGSLTVASSRAQEGAWSGTAKLAEALGVGDEYREMDPAGVQAICGSPAFGSGVYMRDGATIQPARLARGLRGVLLQRGVRIFEESAVIAFSRGRPVTAKTPTGSVRADHAVIALNAWAASWKPFRRRLVAWGGYIVLTAPAPAHLAAIGWTKGECITDARTSLHYFRTTPDGRVAFGGGGGEARFGRAIDPVSSQDQRSVEQTTRGFRRLFPSFSDIPIEESWDGPIDVSPIHLPFFGSLAPGNIHYAFGYSGNGVAPSHLAGKVMAALIVGKDDDVTRLPLVDTDPKRFPFEPFRSIGAHVFRNAILRKDDLEDAGMKAGVLTDLVARLPRRLGYRLGPG